MTAARETQALATSLAIHLLLLLLFVVVRQPLREAPPVPVLRLTLTPRAGAPMAAPAMQRPTPATARESSARQQPAAGRSELPPLAAPRTGFAIGPGPPALPATTAGAVVLPTPSAALAGALAAGGIGTTTGTAPSAPAAERPPAPRIEHRGLPGVRRGMALGYPAELMRRGIEADVEMRLTVATDGTVVHIETLQSSGLSSVDAEVERALRQVLFAASAAGPVTGKVRVSYRLERGF